jgi:hypothetical protein
MRAARYASPLEPGLALGKQTVLTNNITTELYITPPERCVSLISPIAGMGYRMGQAAESHC